MFTLFRKRNERFYESGRMIVGLIERCSSVVAQAIATTPGKRNTRRNAHTAAMARVNQEAMELRRTLLVVCTRQEETAGWLDSFSPVVFVSKNRHLQGNDSERRSTGP